MSVTNSQYNNSGNAAVCWLIGGISIRKLVEEKYLFYVITPAPTHLFSAPKSH